MTLKMNVPKLPRDVLNIFWEFAYGIRPERHPLNDLRHVLDVQKSIPPILLASFVPCRPLFPTGAELIALNCLHRYFKLLTPNPFIKGNAYFPSSALAHPCCVWSDVLMQLTQMLTSKAIKNHRTYRGVLLRKGRRLLDGGISAWNVTSRMFRIESLWCDPESYYAYHSLDRVLVSTFCLQIPRALLLTEL